MAIQAQLYSENLGFPLGGDDGGGGNSSQDWMDNACGFNDLYLLNLQQQLQQQEWQQLKRQYQQAEQQIIQLPKNQDLCSEKGFLIAKDNVNNNMPISIHSQRVAAHIQKQNQEIEEFIGLQNERLRLGLQAHRKQLLLTILNKYELKSQILLRQKDEEITRATNRTIELEDFLRRTDVERQTWQRVAKESEAMVINLHNTIEQLRENCYLSTTKNEVEDAESCCQTGDKRGANDGREEQENKSMMCKSCFSMDSCVVILPCRHLCSCKSCDAFLDSCPVCKMVKKASIEVAF